MKLYGLFTVRKPRRYHHTYIYVDERKEKLDKMREHAKRELGMLPGEKILPEDIRGKFVEHTVHLKRRKESRRKPLHFAVILFFIGLLLCLWYTISHGII